MALMKEISILISELDDAIAKDDTRKAGARFKELCRLAKGDYNTVEKWIQGAHGHDEDN